MGESEMQQEIAQLRAEVVRVDNWANGVFLVLAELLPPLLKQHPEIAAQLVDSWREASEKFERGNQDDQELLEARKMLYCSLDLLGAWPTPGRE